MALSGKNVMDKVKSTAAAAAEAAGNMNKKVGNKREEARIGECIAQLKREISGLYESIGEKIYQSGAQEIRKSDFAEMTAAIEEKYIKIKEHLYRAAELKGMVLCPDCGRECDNEDAFCSKCGAKLPGEEE